MQPWVMFVSFFLFVFGLVIGSFLNVVIYRTIHGQNFVTGRSMCTHCHKVIRWFDNIPLFSFLILRGKCRNCKKPISLMYPVVEFMTGALFVWWFTIGFAFFRLTTQPLTAIQPLFWLGVGLLFIVIFFADLRYGIIPDEATIALSVMGLGYRIVLVAFNIMPIQDLWWTLAGAVGACLFFLFLWVITKEKGIGFGDVKLVFPLGLIVGWPYIFVTLLSAFISGAVVGVAMLFLHKKTFKQSLPFGPFLVASAVFTLVLGERVWAWYWTMLK